ncbi:MAG: NAD(P)/FAD-dependent oxidoreductase [Thermoplasmata archaeon]|nr:MAG: NAD(P)/FAD-dependent oxidoreductase [Thermoplasmata archaeon]
MNDADVVVVGSGPAGSTTACFAAKTGAKVLIIDRRAEVGIPVLCGEGISRKIDDFRLFESTRWIANRVDGARIYSPDGTMVKLSAEQAGNETGYVIHRDIFDKELAASAIRAGAKIMLNTEATGLLRENGKIKGVIAKQFEEKIEIRADIVVGADGVESRVGRWADINTRLKPHDLETCAQYTLANVEVTKEYCDFYLGNSIAPGGYIWIFPKEKDIANVGIGILASRSKPGMALRLLNRFINSHPELKKGEPLRLLAGAVPVAQPIETTRDNLILVGDAARHADPITGGGLTTAIQGGKIAGETIAQAIQQQRFDKETLSEYENRWKETFGKKLRRNYVVKETVLNFDDKTLNLLAGSLKNYKFEEFSTLGLIKALVTKHPTLLMKLKPLIKISTT